MALKRGRIAPIVIGVLGTSVLLGLCAWQVQRLDWKERLIARLESRLSADPVAVPDVPDPERDNFLNVAVEGTLGAAALYRLTTLRPDGPGFQVIVPIETGGRRVAADLGYVPEAQRGAAVPPPGTAVSLTGALFWAESGGGAPPPDLDRRMIFSRAVGPISEILETEPLLVVASRHDLGTRPRAIALGVDLPNNHLNYAITWGLLAVVWAAMSVIWARRA